MADQQFEILVSTEDYLKLQSRCADLQHQSKSLKQTVSQQNSKILWINQQNSQQFKKLRQNEDNIKYLSMQGIKMAQTILQMTQNNKKQENCQQKQTCEKCVQAENVQKVQKISSSLYKKITVEEERSLRLENQGLRKQVGQLQERLKLLSALTNKQMIHYDVQTLPIQQICQKCQKIKCQFTQQIRKSDQKNKKLVLQIEQNKIKFTKQLQQHKSRFFELQKKLEDVTKQNQQLSKTKQSQQKKHQQTISILNKQNQQLKQRLKKVATQNDRIYSQMTKLVQSNAAKIQAKQKQKQLIQVKVRVQKQGQYNQIVKELHKLREALAAKERKLGEAQQNIREFQDLFGGLNLQIRNLEKTMKEKDQLITFYQQTEKQNVQQILKLQAKLKKIASSEQQKQKKQNQNRQNFQKNLEQYFTNFAVKMLEGGASKNQIQRTLDFQQKIIKQFMHDIVIQLLNSFGIKHKNAPSEKPSLKLPRTMNNWE